jgi:hypothetical protein
MWYWTVWKLEGDGMYPCINQAFHVFCSMSRILYISGLDWVIDDSLGMGSKHDGGVGSMVFLMWWAHSAQQHWGIVSEPTTTFTRLTNKLSLS